MQHATHFDAEGGSPAPIEAAIHHELDLAEDIGETVPQPRQFRDRQVATQALSGLGKLQTVNDSHRPRMIVFLHRSVKIFLAKKPDLAET